MSDFYRQELKHAKELTLHELQSMGLKIVWDDDMIDDRLGEPMARPIVVKGSNGLFPGYIFQGNHIIFVTLNSDDLEQASNHAVAAMRSVVLNE